MISAVAIAASFASCNKVEQDNNTPVETPAVDGTTTLTISAAVPQTKTNLNEGTVRWSADDVIAVLAKGYEPVRSLPVDAAAATFDFTVEGWPAGVTPQYAAFTGPYTQEEYYAPYKPTWNEDGTIQTTVRSNQPIYNQGSFSKIANISIGELNEAEGGKFTAVLKNVCGLIKFTLTKPTKSVEIANADPEGQSMAGKVNVAMENGVPRATFVPETGGNIKITSNIKDSGNLLAHDGAHTYYAVVIPGTYTPIITITPAEGESITLTAKSSVTINRNEYVDFGEIDKVETSGTGGGEEGGDEPVGDPIVLDVKFAEFTPSIPGTATLTKNEYSWTSGEKTYHFTLYSPGKGYRTSSPSLRLVGSITKNDNTGYPGYMTLPAIEGYKLTGVEITGGNDSGSKTYKIFDKDPIDEEVTDEVELGSVLIKQRETQTIQVEDSDAKVYYLCCPGLSSDSNAQFTKLVLTYTPAN